MKSVIGIFKLIVKYGAVAMAVIKIFEFAIETLNPLIEGLKNDKKELEQPIKE